MLPTSTRLLKLLSLLQSRRSWAGPELAERLEVDVRTVRRDIDRLRRLGYPVQAAPGSAGGYRLGAGAELPPLLLDDEEAVAVAVGLRTATLGTVAGIEETSLRALAKLEQLLPSRLRRRVNALQTYTVSLVGSAGRSLPTCWPRSPPPAAIASGSGSRIAATTGQRATAPSSRTASCTSGAVGTFWPGTSTGRTGARSVSTGSGPGRPPTSASSPASCLERDVGAYVAAAVSAARDRYQARVILHAPLAKLEPRVPPTYGTLEAIDDESCLLRTGSDWLGGLAVYVAMIGVDFEVLEPPEFVEQVRVLADRFRRATP